MDRKIKAIEEYLKYFPKDSKANENLLLCKYAQELGMELKENSYYPRIEYRYFVINSQIKVGKNYNLTNSKTNYQLNGVDSIVIWSESCGRLAFVSQDYWYEIEEEWEEFCNILLSYNPLDYDYINNNYIYSLEDGKRLIVDYEEIVKNLREKINKKVKEVQIERKKKEIERLTQELEE